MRDSNPQPLRPKRSRLPNWRNPRFFTHYDASHQSFDCRELHPIHHSFQRKIPTGGEDGIRTHDLVLARDLLSQLSYNPINNLENFIKNMIASFYPVLIQRYALFSHSDDKSEPHPRRDETSYRSFRRNPSTKGTLFTPNFHPSFRIFDYYKSSLKFSNQTEPWATRTTIGFLHVSVQV